MSRRLPACPDVECPAHAASNEPATNPPLAPLACAAAWQSERLGAVLFPTADTLPDLRKIDDALRCAPDLLLWSLRVQRWYTPLLSTRALDMHCWCPCVCPATSVALRLCIRSGERLTLMINPQWQPQGQVISGGRAGGTRSDAEDSSSVQGKPLLHKSVPTLCTALRSKSRMLDCTGSCLAPADFGFGKARKAAERFIAAFDEVYYLRWAQIGWCTDRGQLAVWGCALAVCRAGCPWPACWPNLSDWLKAAGAQCCMPAPCAGACVCLGTTSASCDAIPVAGRWVVPPLRLLAGSLQLSPCPAGRRGAALVGCLHTPASPKASHIATASLLPRSPPPSHPPTTLPPSPPLFFFSPSEQVHYVPPPPEPGSGRRVEPPVLLACEDGKPTFQRLIGLLKGVQGSRSVLGGWEEGGHVQAGGWRARPWWTHMHMLAPWSHLLSAPAALLCRVCFAMVTRREVQFASSCSHQPPALPAPLASPQQGQQVVAGPLPH